MDLESVRSATKSELQTFRVLANTEFADFNKPDPKSSAWKPELPDHWGGANSAVDAVDDKSVGSVRTYLKPIEPDEPVRSPSVDSRHSKHSVRSVQSKHSAHSEKTLVSEVKKHEYSEKAYEEAKVDVDIEKEALLYELELMEKQGSIKLHRQLSMSDSLESIQYQYDRANMIISTQQTVDWAKTGIKVGSGLLETVVKKFGLNIVDGFSTNLCKDMNKFNSPLTKMYRKYWRRGSSSPESELAMIVFGALAMTIMANKGLMGLGTKSEPFARPQAPVIPGENAFKPPEKPSETREPPQPSVPPKLPEWARAALATPLQEKPKHFASENYAALQANKTVYPNELLSVPQVIMPVSQVPSQPQPTQPSQPSQPTPSQPSQLSQPSQELVSSLKSLDDGVRKLTIPTPRTSRKKREPVAELNFD